MLVIGFAAVSTIIYINGITNIGANLEDYSIYFSDAYIDNTRKLDIISEDKQKITINTKVLKNIGDSEKIEYDVTNASKQYDAKVSITCEPTENEYYEMEHVFEHDIIKARTYETGYITIKLKKVSVEEQDIEFTCTLKVGALEKTEINTSKVQTRCEYDEGQEWNFDYKGVEQTFEVPCNATYKLEVWGAQGGGNGGQGGYSIGNIKLKLVDKLYIYVGGAGRGTSAGYNGGGAGAGSGNGGGGATHIATLGGVLSTLSTKKESILIVAGGGGGSNSRNSLGGSGGGLTGGTGAISGNSNAAGGGGGTQVSGGGVDGSYRRAGSFGLGGNTYSIETYTGGAGGGGYYGGGSGTSGTQQGSGGGGSGYLSPSLIEGSTNTTNGQRSGNGYAKITLVSLN